LNKTDLARSYADTYKNEISNKTAMARIMIKENPGKFKDLENARFYIRRAFGRTGNKLSKQDIGRAANCKVLLFDIETLPILSYHWGMYQVNISHNHIVKDWCMLSWAGKWLFDNEIKGDILTPKEAKIRRDKRISQSLWDLFDEADVLIAHNLKKFDRKKANARFILNGLEPPSPYEMIDTLLVARKEFGFTSNRLNFLGQILVRDEKIDTDFNLWRDCDNGVKESLDFKVQK